MFYKELEKSKRVLNLQLFAEGDGDGAGEGGTDNSGGGAEPKVPTFETFAEFQSYIDSENDKHSNKAIQTAKQKWEADKQQAIEDAKAEALRTANMSAEEKLTEAEKQRLAQIEEREQALLVRELKTQAIDALNEKGLPTDLANVLTYSNEDNLKSHLQALEKAYLASVETGVDKRLADSAYKPPAGGNPKPMTQGELVAQKMNEQNKTKKSFWD